MKKSQVADSQEIADLEERIPDVASAAFEEAFQKALKSGRAVLVIENDALVEIQPDGSRRIIRRVKAKIRVKQGQKIQLK